MPTASEPRLARLRPPRTLALPASALAALVVGGAGGALWGVVARGWMRFISARHEFSWEGTRAIILIFAIFGVGQAMAAVLRRSNRGRRWQLVGRIVAIATTVPLGIGAGATMLPSTIVGAVALGRTAMPPRWRLVLAALAVVGTLFVLQQLVDDLDLWRAVAGWALMYAVYLPLVWALSRALLPGDKAVPAMRP